MLIKKSQVKKKINSDQCIFWEYDSQSKDVSFAIAYINGRFPEQKRVVNTECEEIYYVLSGSGVIHSEFGNFIIEKGDFYHFKKGEKYWSKGKELKLVLVNIPRWSSEQLKFVK
jgi:mannose-6-phosphate isomerase-like protein (cupin superfamily)